VAPSRAHAGGTIWFCVRAIGSDIYIFGGHLHLRLHATVFKFDTEANDWSTLAPMPLACYGHSASVLDGQPYIIGTEDDYRGVLRIDPASGVWSTLAQTSIKRKDCACFVIDEFLCAAGGRDLPLSVERYDVTNNTWEAVADMIEGRRYFGSVTI
jgi:hypothetical protein